MSIYKIDRHMVELTHPDRVIFPRIGATKGDLFAYYQKIAPFMIDHIKRRIISLQRFPEGIAHDGFYQKNAADYFPSWIKRFPLKTHAGEIAQYILCTNQAMLLYLVNQGCITFHRWLSRIDKVESPDQLVFDLDPAKTNRFANVVWAARLLKERLEQDRVTPFVMTTGSKGVHLIVPLKRRYSFEHVRMYAGIVANDVAAYDPKRLTVHASKIGRTKALYIDILRNAYGQTAVAPFSVRATPHASIAMPVTWQELARISTADRFSIQTKNIYARIADNPWKELRKQSVLLPRF